MKVLDKNFIPYVKYEAIQDRIATLAKQIDVDYQGRKPLFLGILNGSFIFAADLYKHITIPSTISFIKLVSYKGTSSTGTVITAIGLEEDLLDRDIIIIEDIVDTGRTMNAFLPTLEKLQPHSIKICTLLHKPDALQCNVQLDYIGFEIPDKFVVGYGLDYDGYGRNSKDIYQIEE